MRPHDSHVGDEEEDFDDDGLATHTGDELAEDFDDDDLATHADEAEDDHDDGLLSIPEFGINGRPQARTMSNWFAYAGIDNDVGFEFVDEALFPFPTPSPSHQKQC
jgi:hypothetical protein